MNIKNYRPIKEVLEEKVEAALLELDNIENVVQARVNKEIVKEYKPRKLSELELKEEQRGITQSSKQTRNARASKNWEEYLVDLEKIMIEDATHLVKRENALTCISAWQTATKEEKIKV